MNEVVQTAIAKSGIEFSIESSTLPTTIKVAATDLLALAQHLQADPALFFDQLTCVTGIDNGPDANTMEVLYHFYSIPFHQSLALKVVLARSNPEVETLSGLWKSANWMEREVYDMFGITFLNHPDLRRILMPADWEGFPLRKDYQHQEKYRDIQVKS